MTIYLDVVLLENLIMNGIIVYVTAIITKTKINNYTHISRTTAKYEKPAANLAIKKSSR